MSGNRLTVFGLKNGFMEKHICALLRRFQSSEQLKETAALCIVFEGEEPRQVMADVDIHNSYMLRNLVRLYQHKVQTGLFIRLTITQAQKRDMQALQ